MSSKFVPQDNSKAEALVAKLGNSPFRDPDTFVKMYNAGLINQSNAEVSKIVDEILESYKGIEKRNRSLYFLSSGEIAIDELLELAKAYSVLIPMMRAVKDAELDLSTSVKIVNGKLVAVTYEESEDSFEEVEKVISDKLVTKTAPLDYMKRVSGISFEEGDLFTAEDLMRINDNKVFLALEQLN